MCWYSFADIHYMLTKHTLGILYQKYYNRIARYCKLQYYYWFSCCELRKWSYRQVVFLNLLIFSFLALAVYSRCPYAYEALCNLNILQLPCSKVLKRVLKEGSEKPEVVEDYLRQQLEEFCEYRKQPEAGGFPKPLGLGI